MDLKAIEERLEGISPWPWFKFRRVYIGTVRPDVQQKTIIARVYTYPYVHCSGHNNAIFFANAPQDVSTLIEEVKRLREKMAGMEEAWNEAEYRRMEKDPYG